MIPIAKPLIGEEEKRLVREVLDSGMLAQGPKVAELEKRFAAFCGTKHAIAVCNGTAALHTALHAAGIGPGDEVITVPFTFVATANAILMCGANPVFVDIDEKTFCIDPSLVEKAITQRTKAILPVDLYGLPADYTALRKIAKKHNIIIVEDACQAHGAEIKGVRTGKLGDIAAFSLYATKNMISGEGGLVTTDDDGYADRCRRFRHHGQGSQYEYIELGYNYRMMDLQAAIALPQLDRLEKAIARRIVNAKKLSDGLRGIPGITVPTVPSGNRHVFHQYTIICDNVHVKRDALLAYLKEHGVGACVYYPKPLHLHSHFSGMGYKRGAFPVSERLAEQVLSLPVHPTVTEDDVGQIVAAVQQFTGGHA